MQKISYKKMTDGDAGKAFRTYMDSSDWPNTPLPKFATFLAGYNAAYAEGEKLRAENHQLKRQLERLTTKLKP